MPVDSSIYQNLLRPAASPLEYANQYTQQAAATQNLLASRMQMQQQQEATQRRNSLRDYLATGVQGEDLEKGLLSRGYVDEALKFGKDRRENTKLDNESQAAQALTRQRQVDTQRKLYEIGVQMMQGAPDAQTAVTILQQGVGKGAWGLEEAQASIQALQKAMQGGPQALTDWKQNQLRTILAPKDLMPKIETRNTGGSTDTLAVDPFGAGAKMVSSVRNTATPGDMMTDARVRAEGAANRGVTMRGQDMVDARTRELNTITKEDKAAQRKTEATDKAVTKFSDTIQKEGIPELETAVGQAESAIGRYKPGQVPGVGPIKNALPTAMMSDEGKDVRQALAQVRNIVLNARSGAAVTDQELRRLVDEIGSGAGMTEADLRRGLKKVRDRLDMIKTNTAAGVSDDVLSTYRDRGGLDIKRGQKPGGLTPAEAAELEQLRARFGKK